jgi:hypothetical protein
MEFSQVKIWVSKLANELKQRDSKQEIHLRVLIISSYFFHVLLFDA